MKSLLLLLILINLIQFYLCYQQGVVTKTLQNSKYIRIKIPNKIYCLPILKKLSDLALKNYKNFILAFGRGLKRKCYDSKFIYIPKFSSYPSLIEFPFQSIIYYNK
jgi:hypothetical protein